MRSPVPISDRRLTYEDAGATAPAQHAWTPPTRYRAHETTVDLGHGEDTWTWTASAVLEWGVKTRSGFTVEPAAGVGSRVQAGDRWWLRAHLGPVAVREPVEIVAFVDERDRVGFAYGTLDGHPVSGEEAFVVHRDAAGGVRLTLRSLTRPGRGIWRVGFPAVLVAQRVYRRRYVRSLQAP